ncbi:MAG TPA: hypothetical protein VMZ91_00650 [Candidatus Paceibacterota bacterium]|nr:hypothetical protein [Candidatus Paceibacterota bacterium]
MKRPKCKKCHTVLLTIYTRNGATRHHLNNLYYCRFCDDIIKIVDDKQEKIKY